MDAGIFVVRDEQSLIRMNARPYENELDLQLLLAKYPDLLAGDQINPSDPRRWLLVEQEAGVPGEMGGGDWWALDHLFLDQDAVPTFVEVKRAADTRSRREVVAQMLDYAANATRYWPVDRMRASHARRCADLGLDPASELADFVGADEDEQVFWDRARSNLQEGRIRLLFVADRIPESLRRIVEFLNQHMSPPEVLAVEIPQYASATDASLRTLVPRVIGQTEQALDAKAVSRSPSQSRQSSPISREEFVEGIPVERRDIVLAVLLAAEATGFAATALQYATGDPWMRFTLAGVSGTPAYLSYKTLTVSVGRHHAALREPDTNQEIRQALLLISPSSKNAGDPKKTEVGIPIESIEPERLDHLTLMFDLVKRALVES